jgi:hypothetical protein
MSCGVRRNFLWSGLFGWTVSMITWGYQRNACSCSRKVSGGIGTLEINVELVEDFRLYQIINYNNNYTISLVITFRRKNRICVEELSTRFRRCFLETTDTLWTKKYPDRRSESDREPLIFSDLIYRTFTVQILYKLYSLKLNCTYSINCVNFWVFPQRLFYIGRRFGTISQVHLQRLVDTSSLWKWTWQRVPKRRSI